MDRLFELRVFALPPCRRIEIDIDVGWRAVILDVPFALQVIKGDARRGYPSAVDQLRIIVNADQAAPRALADRGTYAGFAEEPWHQVAARSRVFIDDHDLRAVDRSRGRREVLALSRGPAVHQRAAHVINDVIGRRASAVESFI